MGHGRDQWQILEAFLVCVIQNVYTRLYCFAFRISQAITSFLLCTQGVTVLAASIPKDCYRRRHASVCGSDWWRVAGPGAMFSASGGVMDPLYIFGLDQEIRQQRQQQQPHNGLILGVKFSYKGVGSGEDLFRSQDARRTLQDTIFSSTDVLRILTSQLMYFTSSNNQFTCCKNKCLTRDVSW